MSSHEEYMRRCLQLAEKGLGNVAPNPLVGCVIVHEGKIIGEGWHQKYGEAHAEVNAITSVENKKLLSRSTLYVNLEPCVHYGKTPPCTDLILQHKIPEVVVGCVDTFPHVSGKGIEKLQRDCIDVVKGVCEKEAREMNKRFFTFHEKKRPYIILKWAETSDGFLDKVRSPARNEKPMQISSEESRKLLHQWRTEEQAILVGTNTVLLDDPQLTARKVKGKNPLRIAVDQWNLIPKTHHLKDGTTPTLIFSSSSPGAKHNIEYVIIQFGSALEILSQILNELYRRGIQSVLIEGGAKLLHSFLEAGFWDEARVFIAKQKALSGVSAPPKPTLDFKRSGSGDDELRVYRNEQFQSIQF